MKSSPPIASPATRAAGTVIEPLRCTATPDAALQVFANLHQPAVLETRSAGSTSPGFSIFAAEPCDSFEHRGTGSPFEAWGKALQRGATAAAPHRLPFAGGWIGYFSYQAGLGTARLSARTSDTPAPPAALWHLYDAAAVYEVATQTWYAVAIDWPEATAARRPGLATRLERVRELLRTAESCRPTKLVGPPRRVAFQANLDRNAYFAAVERAKRYIEAGDVYQVNLARRFTAAVTESPLDVYRRLRVTNPAEYSAFLPWGGHAVLCSSPELFLSLQNGRVVTRPIKGTRPRTGDVPADAASKSALMVSEKDAAELNMIIDLLRNDLGRVCAYGSIRVEREGDIETQATVFHRVATVTGTLAEGRDRVDLLKSTFPGGSITGAPKIRAMQIIDELEPEPRGVYCGAIGHAGLDGSLTLNIAIRTLAHTGGAIEFHVGSGIVADSTPELEFAELEAKARGLWRAVIERNSTDSPNGWMEVP